MSNQFTQGYVCAVAILVKTQGGGSEVHDLLRAQCPTEEKARAARCDPQDIQVLKPFWEEMNGERE